MIFRYFDADGNEIRRNEWVKSLASSAALAAIEQYQQRASDNVARMKCPIHGGKASLMFNMSGSPEKPVIEIEAKSCCDDFAEAVMKEAYRSWATPKT